MCDDSPLRRPEAGQPRGPKDRLREDELTAFSAGHAGIVRIPESATPEARHRSSSSPQSDTA